LKARKFNIPINSFVEKVTIDEIAAAVKGPLPSA
jgi:hypothetical protein